MNAASETEQGGPPEPTTYHALAGLDDEEVGGARYAPRRSPDPIPAQPPHSPWADPVPIEMPLGERVDALPDMTTIDGFNARDLVPWEYGPQPSEQHSAYPPDTECEAWLQHRLGCPRAAETVMTTQDVIDVITWKGQH